MWGVPRVPGYTGRASRVSGFEASDFFCCVAFLSIDGIAPKAVLSGVTQVDPFAHLGEAPGYGNASKREACSLASPGFEPSLKGSGHGNAVRSGGIACRHRINAAVGHSLCASIHLAISGALLLHGGSNDGPVADFG